MVGTVLFGSWMLWQAPGLLAFPWMWLKLIVVVLLLLYHFECHRIFNQQSSGIYKLSSFRLRLFNELATVFLVAVVFLVVVKSTSGLLWGLLGLIAFASVLMLAVYVYKRNRKENEVQTPEVTKEEGKS